MISPADRGLVVLGALAGMGGVALAAAAAHGPGPSSLETASRFLLLHAPVLMALPALIAAGLVRPAVARAAGYGLAAGLLLFSGDLALRSHFGLTIWRFAAPTGGVLLLLGWALAALSAALGSGRWLNGPRS